MQELLTVIVTWLAVNFGLPAIYDHPRVEFASSMEMMQVRYDRLASDETGCVSALADHPSPHDFQFDVHGIYDDLGRTIYLPEEWTGATPADVSLLVHELVHHLQNVAALQYDCPEAREKPAYQAQARWLELFGQSLEEEFGIDAMTILVRTNCMR